MDVSVKQGAVKTIHKEIIKIFTYFILLVDSYINY